MARIMSLETLGSIMVIMLLSSNCILLDHSINTSQQVMVSGNKYTSEATWSTRDSTTGESEINQDFTEDLGANLWSDDESSDCGDAYEALAEALASNTIDLQSSKRRFKRIKRRWRSSGIATQRKDDPSYGAEGASGNSEAGQGAQDCNIQDNEGRFAGSRIDTYDVFVTGSTKLTSSEGHVVYTTVTGGPEVDLKNRIAASWQSQMTLLLMFWVGCFTNLRGVFQSDAQPELACKPDEAEQPDIPSLLDLLDVDVPLAHSEQVQSAWTWWQSPSIIMSWLFGADPVGAYWTQLELRVRSIAATLDLLRDDPVAEAMGRLKGLTMYADIESTRNAVKQWRISAYGDTVPRVFDGCLTEGEKPINRGLVPDARYHLSSCPRCTVENPVNTGSPLCGCCSVAGSTFEYDWSAEYNLAQVVIPFVAPCCMANGIDDSQGADAEAQAEAEAVLGLSPQSAQVAHTESTLPAIDMLLMGDDSNSQSVSEVQIASNPGVPVVEAPDVVEMSDMDGNLQQNLEAIRDSGIPVDQQQALIDLCKRVAEEKRQAEEAYRNILAEHLEDETRSVVSQQSEVAQ